MMNNITRASFSESIVVILLTSLCSCSWADQSGEKPFQPSRIELPGESNQESILYEGLTAKVRGFSVRWEDEQGRQMQYPLLRIFSDSIEERMIAALPKARLNIKEGSDGVRYRDELKGEKTAGNRTIVLNRASGGGIRSILVDGQEQPLYDGVYAPKLSANGKHFAYCAVSKTTRKQFAVIDGQKHEQFDWCTGVVFSPDGNRYAYVAGNTGQAFVVIDGSRGAVNPSSRFIAVTIEPIFGYQSFNGPEFISWSPDSEKVSYVLPDGYGTTGQVFVNERPLSSIKCDIDLSAWSNDSKHFAYIGKLPANNECIVLDGKQLTTHGYIHDFIFSPDGSRLAYYVWDSQEPNCRVFCQGLESQRFFRPDIHVMIPWTHNVTAVVFSPDSKHLAYVARDSRDAGKWFVMLDGEPLQKYDDILTVPVFEGNRIIYVAVIKGEEKTKVVQVSNLISQHGEKE